MSLVTKLSGNKITLAGVVAVVMGVLFGALNLTGSLATAEGEPEVYYHSASPLRLHQQDHYLVDRKYVGKVSARQHADIGFELAGKIASINFDEGQTVKAGDVIAQQNIELLGIERLQVEAQLVEARANLKLNKSNLKRQASLELSGYASKQRFDELEAQGAGLNASISRLDASIASIDSRISKSTLLAPFAGHVTRRFIDEGVVTGPGHPVVRLQQEGVMEAHVGVPVQLLSSMKIGEAYQVIVNGEAVSSHLIAISADVNPITRTVVVRLELPQQTSAGVPLNGVNGSLVYMVLTESVASTGFWVPLDAITDGTRGLWTVFALTPAEQGLYKSEPRDVMVEYATSSEVFIRGGISDGELVVKEGLHRLAPRQLVKINAAVGE
jgi:RND family efflux transporter MFP subunit